jgi:hypothetical protein
LPRSAEFKTVAGIFFPERTMGKDARPARPGGCRGAATLSFRIFITTQPATKVLLAALGLQKLLPPCGLTVHYSLACTVEWGEDDISRIGEPW